MRQRKVFLHLWILALICVFAVPALSQEEGKEKMRSRLEQLFIWRVSDKLQLTPDEETKFAAEYKKLSEDRADAFHKMDDILNKLSEVKDDKKARAKLLSEYEEASKKSVRVQDNELPAMKKIFTQDQLVEYVLLKREMFHKFRDALATSKTTSVADSPDKPKLKEPEVIQQK
jgi:hypothetical protein